uniref:ShKT domain-containing protein n=1 Tax=Bursaphelenchus xylophilus TaxID=6326 RepID=A0A1I7SHV6_BURXY
MRIQKKPPISGPDPELSRTTPKASKPSKPPRSPEPVNRVQMRGVCIDKNVFCGYWSRMGECKNESKFMRVFCKKSCGFCP